MFMITCQKDSLKFMLEASLKLKGCPKKPLRKEDVHAYLPKRFINKGFKLMSCDFTLDFKLMSCDFTLIECKEQFGFGTIQWR